jgi:cobalt/nickel transport system permease protein
MAVVAPLVAYCMYRAVAGSSAIASTRRVIAAGLAGYVSINAAALCAAIEFGLQPLLFKDASGAPLYAPYPLSIAIPAMMAGHLTVAGLAELIVSAGLVAWLQRSHPSLLRLTAPDARCTDEPLARNGWRATRPLWTALAVLMLLTPLGILAVGTAWGEWSPGEFSDPAARNEIAAASRNTAPPAEAPSGMRRLSSLWTAPLPDYAPPFLRSAGFGYALSGLFGAGLILLTALLADWALWSRGRPSA